MTTKTHTTRTGRIVIETDGHNGYGNLEQGKIICKISVPAGSSVQQVLNELPNCPNAGPDYIAGIHAAVPGIRVYHWRRVQ